MNFTLIAISTGLQYLPARLKKELGFDCVLSNALLSKNGILTGKVKIAITHAGKGTALKEILKEKQISASKTITVGDSDGDIPMAKISGYSIAFNSTSGKLSKTADYDCKTKDFNEIYLKTMEILGK